MHDEEAGDGFGSLVDEEKEEGRLDESDVGKAIAHSIAARVRESRTLPGP